MNNSWIDPGRVEAHRMLRLETLSPLPAGRPARSTLPVRTVEDIFYRGQIREIVNSPQDVINTRLDAVIGRLPGIGLPPNDERARWGQFAREANLRRQVAQPFLGLSLQIARELLATDFGHYLIKPLPFEDRARRNDGYELLYFRDSGLHRRLVERAFRISPRDGDRAARRGLLLDERRDQQLERYVPQRWEAFVVVSILDLVGDRCKAFAYRNEETAEIDLILEWRDQSPVERWAIEIAGRKFNAHPSSYFPESCDHLGVGQTNRFVVFRADGCDGTKRGRRGVKACALPRMLYQLHRRMGSFQGTNMT